MELVNHLGQIASEKNERYFWNISSTFTKNLCFIERGGKMLEKFRLIGIVVGVLTSSVAWSQAVPAAKERTVTVGNKTVVLKSRLKNILHANFTFDFHHNEGKVVIQKTLEDLSASEGWKLTTITNHSQITLAELKKYEAVVFDNISAFD
jgi:hypothetical protein